jgi:hypothetical protein
MHAEEDLVQLGDHGDEAWLDQALMSLLMKLNRRFVRVSLPVFLCLSLCACLFVSSAANHASSFSVPRQVFYNDDGYS